MASYHLSVKTVSRAAGRSATAAAAYRSAARIADERTGEVHDYARRGGVASADLLLPTSAPIVLADRAKLWNAAEAAENRRNSTVAREFEVALPSELDAAQRRALVLAFAREIMERHGCAVDVAIHAPHREGDQRNHHAHILCTTRRVDANGFGAKTRELDDQKSGEVVRWRARFAELQNQHLEQAQVSARVDHRSLKDQGIDRPVMPHLGPAAVGFERRTGLPSRMRLDFQEEVNRRLERAHAIGALDRQAQAQVQRIALVSSSLDFLRDQASEHPVVGAALDRRDTGPRQVGQTFGQGISDTEFETLSVAQLRAKARRLKVPELAELVAQDPTVRAAEQALHAAVKRREEAWKLQEESAQAEVSWRREHPIQAQLHDHGIRQAPDLTRLAEERSAAEQRHAELGMAGVIAGEALAQTRLQAELQIGKATAGARQRDAVLEQQIAQKAQAEQLRLDARRARLDVAFTELAGLPQQAWRACSPQLQLLLLRHNDLPPAHQPTFREREVPADLLRQVERALRIAVEERDGQGQQPSPSSARRPDHNPALPPRSRNRNRRP